MKKVILLAVAGVLSFVAGTAGIYIAMPTIAPAVVDSTRIRLDSLGLLPLKPELEQVARPTDVQSIQFDPSTGEAESDSTDSLATATLPSVPTIEVPLGDSLRRTTDILNNLKTDKAALLAQIEELTKRLNKLETQQADAAELSVSLSKLEDRQLTGILTDLDLNVVEMLYLEASVRDRPRLLQNLPPDRAARFVKTLVKAPASTNDMAARQDTSNEAGESNQ